MLAYEYSGRATGRSERQNDDMESAELLKELQKLSSDLDEYEDEIRDYIRQRRVSAYIQKVRATYGYRKT